MRLCRPNCSVFLGNVEIECRFPTRFEEGTTKHISKYRTCAPNEAMSLTQAAAIFRIRRYTEFTFLLAAQTYFYAISERDTM